FNTIKEDASIFYIEVDGNQQVQPGKYLFSVSGECYI
ncbi:aggregative adherence fimbria 4 minor subunit Agg4B/HdaB, partial [Escherichia coli]|nr:aggregative adherence fimbria 4 minor subunit Agg4B/HdaB [Escherichia coli]